MDRDCTAIFTEQLEPRTGDGEIVPVEQKHRCGLFDDHLGAHVCKSCGTGW